MDNWTQKAKEFRLKIVYSADGSCVYIDRDGDLVEGPYKKYDDAEMALIQLVEDIDMHEKRAAEARLMAGERPLWWSLSAPVDQCHAIGNIFEILKAVDRDKWFVSKNQLFVEVRDNPAAIAAVEEYSTSNSVRFRRVPSRHYAAELKYVSDFAADAASN
jgi:hypothetical protein